jgi:predicted XRE-type DNA-binding protein
MSESNSTLHGEEWRSVPGYEGWYDVSNFGRVRSLPIMVKVWRYGERLRIGKILTPSYAGSYPTIRLCRDSIGKTFRLHRLVLETFVGPCPPGMEARHFPDRSHSNNRLDNLSWATKKQNAADKEVQGQSQKGEQGNNAKLRDEDVIRIRRLYATGKLSQKLLGEIFGVCQAQVGRIVAGQRWGHLVA